MFKTTFYRFVPVTKEEMNEVYDREGIAFVIKEDTTEEVKKIRNTSLANIREILKNDEW